ncbi:MAG: ATP synthase F1 subunit delta [Acidobacteria bacterium]|nr:ATP synthase F1 subunit delta [Acidobacteriota bacterium]MCI0620999.1 ATP synthase F1 subunit delta [Acidobacteriota bacterium]MCI0719459.1 ATP synthase F1 subunit delta [Acidobacteriota bacterium]
MPAIANRYAKALVDVSLKLNQHEQVARELLQFEDLLASQKELALFYSNPAIAVAKKKAATEEILRKLAFCPSTSNFLLILIDNHRMGVFGEIRKAFQHELNNRLGVTQAEVTTAAELDEETHQKLEAKLAALTGKKVALKFANDPGLIGGVVTRIGDTIYDGSIRQQLNSMKARLSSD